MGVLLAALFLAAPGAALADECGPQTLPGTPETITCAPGDYASGITYSSDGDLTLQVTDDSDHLDVFETGIDVTGNGGDSVSWDSSAFVNNDIRGTGIVLDYNSNTGAIDLLIGGDVRAQSDATHAIRAISSSGNVTIQTNEGGRIFGGDYGIQAETGDSDTLAGTLDIVVGDSINIDSGTGIAAIDATTDTGLLTIDIVSTGSTNSVSGGQSGSAIRTNASGDAVINVGEGRTVGVSGGNTAGALNLTAVGGTIVNNDGFIGTNFSGNGTAIRAASGTLTLNNISNGVGNNGRINGALDFSGLGDDGYIFNNGPGAEWRAGSFFVSTLGAGVINNAGTIDIGQAGSVIQGEPFGPNRVSAPGTAYTGMAGSVLELEVFFDGRGQTACDENIEVGACLDLSGGSTDGTTELLVSGNTTTALVTGPLTAKSSANAGIVLVDVSGGTSSAGDFVLHPDSCVFEAGTVGCQPAYATDPVYGAVMDLGGILDYTLLYNSGTQQHVLTTVPSPEAVQYTALIHEAASIWHTTSDAVAGRQADLRKGATGRFWARFSADRTERDSTPTATIQGNRFAYDQDYTLDTNTLIFGFDSSSGDNHVIGIHGGMVESRLEFDGSGSRDETKGVTGGVYAGWWQDNGLSLDGTLNANMVTADHEVEGFEKSDIDILSLGLRVEAGWRLPLMEDALYIQPLATATYMTADIDTVELQDNTIGVEDANSLRGALGFRLGGEAVLNSERIDSIGYWLTARAWDEQSDEGEVQFKYRDGGHLAIEDDRSGSFEEVALGVDFTSQEGTLSGYLTAGAKSGDNEDGFNVSVGLRKNW